MKKSKRQKMNNKKVVDFRAVYRKFIFALPSVMVVSVIGIIGLIYQQVEIETILPIEEVVVEGELNFVSRERVAKVVLDNVKGGYFTLNLEMARQHVLFNPWIKTVTVRRQWPGRLIVTIAEKQPVAYWNKRAFISQNGDVFQPEKMDLSMLIPHMSGPTGQHEKVWLFMNEIYQPLAELGFEVRALKADERRAWSLQLSHGNVGTNENRDTENVITVSLGRYDTEQRFNRFLRVFTAMKDTDFSHLGLIDMRYPNGFALTNKALINKDRQILAEKNMNIKIKKVGVTGSHSTLNNAMVEKV